MSTRSANFLAASELAEHPDAVLGLDSRGGVIAWNAAAVRLLRPGGDLSGIHLSDVVTFSPRDGSGLFPHRQWAAFCDTRLPVEVTEWDSARTGRAVRLLSLRDVSPQVDQEDELEATTETLRRQARVDALTGLANRHELEERLASALEGSADRGRPALIVLDLDGFKQINDQHGHVVGDEVLVAVARRLRELFSHHSVVARLGGDEFVILTAVDAPGQTSVAAARAREAFVEPITTAAGPVKVGGSVGIALAEPDGDAQDLLRRADKAMYRSKLSREEMVRSGDRGSRIARRRDRADDWDATLR